MIKRSVFGSIQVPWRNCVNEFKHSRNIEILSEEDNDNFYEYIRREFNCIDMPYTRCVKFSTEADLMYFVLKFS
jgi:hypothetical protein